MFSQGPRWLLNSSLWPDEKQRKEKIDWESYLERIQSIMAGEGTAAEAAFTCGSWNMRALAHLSGEQGAEMG